nr:uncharacterized protein LOC120965467 [Aegilops tauschii subsp. strangulata]
MPWRTQLHHYPDAIQVQVQQVQLQGERSRPTSSNNVKQGGLGDQTEAAAQAGGGLVSEPQGKKIESGCNCFDIPVWPPGMLIKYNEVSSSDYCANGCSASRARSPFVQLQSSSAHLLRH